MDQEQILGELIGERNIRALDDVTDQMVKNLITDIVSRSRMFSHHKNVHALLIATRIVPKILINAVMTATGSLVLEGGSKEEVEAMRRKYHEIVDQTIDQVVPKAETARKEMREK